MGKDLTKGKELETIAFGKPQIGTFEFATRLLQQWRKDEHRINRPPETVYFVGDTPESDIRGTNMFNEKSKNDWYSILVKTGVYQDGTEREMAKKGRPVGGTLPLSAMAFKNLSLNGERIGSKTPIMEVTEPNTPETQTPEAVTPAAT